jgi:hypothetical protein
MNKKSPIENEEMPEVGAWYRRADHPQPFQVVACDAEDGTVDIEYFDGTIDEWPLSHWRELAIEPTAAPEDWSGAYDNIDADDLDSTADRRHSAAWPESGSLPDEPDLEFEPPT